MWSVSRGVLGPLPAKNAAKLLIKAQFVLRPIEAKTSSKTHTPQDKEHTPQQPEQSEKVYCRQKLTPGSETLSFDVRFVFELSFGTVFAERQRINCRSVVNAKCRGPALHPPPPCAPSKQSARSYRALQKSLYLLRCRSESP